MLFDTHAHLNDVQFAEDRKLVIQRAWDEGVRLIVNVGFNRATIEDTLQLVNEHAFMYAALGWHPHDVKDLTDDTFHWMEKQIREHPKVVAIGEMGLDYHWDNSPRDLQKQVFRRQIRLAKQLAKPIIIHDRDAHEDVLRILQEERAEEVGGIMHCFGGDVHMAQACLDMNFYISFGGPITFKNAALPKEVARHIPLDRLLIETDSPYLAPHPHRGKRNESCYVALVAQALADIKEVEYETLCRRTFENGQRLFGVHAS